MTNPYHDETGKFCSRGEMMSRIDQIANSGKYEDYAKLRGDFEKIERKKNGFSIFGKTKAQQAAEELTESVRGPVVYHYRSSSQVLEDKLKDIVAKPVDDKDKFARFNEVDKAVKVHFSKNPSQAQFDRRLPGWQGAGEHWRVAAMIFANLGRNDEVNLGTSPR